MKKIILLTLVANFLVSYSQNNVIEEVNGLIKNRKYESALKVLNDADPDNQDPELVIAKTDLLLNYYTKSNRHRMFAIKDLEPGEELVELRSNLMVNFPMFTFNPDSLINRLIAEYPDNFSLRKTLGNYYYEVHIRYNGKWFEPDSIIINSLLENYKIAYEHGIYDYWSVYCIGYGYLVKGDYKESVFYFEESIKLRNDLPLSYYNLALAFLYDNQREKSIENGIKAFELYDYPPYKADAARMIAVTYQELAQNDSALVYYLKADSIQPNNQYTLKSLLDLEMLMGKENYKKRTKEFFNLAPGNPRIYQDLMQIYWSNNKEDELIAFFESLKSYYQADKEVLGNLFFYIATIQYDKRDYQNSKINFEKSREIFKEVYKPNHKVFGVIDTYIKRM